MERWEKGGGVALKLDMSKAYNQVEQGCLEMIFRKMGFHEKWVILMMRCITSVAYSIHINKNPRGRITLTRGPSSKGSTLSLFIFAMCRKLIILHSKGNGGEGNKRSIYFSLGHNQRVYGYLEYPTQLTKGFWSEIKQGENLWFSTAILPKQSKMRSKAPLEPKLLVNMRNTCASTSCRWLAN